MAVPQIRESLAVQVFSQDHDGLAEGQLQKGVMKGMALDVDDIGHRDPHHGSHGEEKEWNREDQHPD